MNKAVREVINRMCPLQHGDRVRIIDETAARAYKADVYYGDTGKVISIWNMSNSILVEMDNGNNWWLKSWMVEPCFGSTE